LINTKSEYKLQSQLDEYVPKSNSRINVNHLARERRSQILLNSHDNDKISLEYLGQKDMKNLNVISETEESIKTNSFYNQTGVSHKSDIEDLNIDSVKLRAIVEK